MLEVYVPGRPKLCKRLLGQLCGFNMGLLMCHLTVVVGRQHFDASKIGQVYPRVYGETWVNVVNELQTQGLSPRVRGNLHTGGRGQLCEGSIPACTGEPHPGFLQPADHRVYPRVYGGTTSIARPVVLGTGLSPRVRGNLVGKGPGRCRDGSIPACTGEPRTVAVHGLDGRVYPRVYGGTPNCRSAWPGWTGLSPRVRGNLRQQHQPDIYPGSIPACTGEPRNRCRSRRLPEVYPRVYGGTTITRDTEIAGLGLSPRVRGNRLPPNRERQLRRSIPACTGEPDAGHRLLSLHKVYPRVYGGTGRWASAVIASQGLSPRVRGNPAPEGCGLALLGSIPACTGEPGKGHGPPQNETVYPRVYGGTRVT